MKSKFIRNSINDNSTNAYNIINIGSISNLSLNTNKFEFNEIKNNEKLKDDLDDYDRVNLKTVSQADYRYINFFKNF